MTLAKAKLALTRAHCDLGKIRGPKHAHPHHVLHVASQSAKRGTTHPVDYRVNVVLH